jgi:uncharacterized protein YndB with AHSA1/START domain
MNTATINIQTNVLASTQKVWEYYTKPAHITKWNFASPDWHCPRAENDMQVGGKYAARMEAKDGSYGFDFEAIYTDIVPGKCFSYVLADQRKVGVGFQPAGDNTIVHVVFDPENENPIELQKNGWQAILDNFKNYVEKN